MLSTQGNGLGGIDTAFENVSKLIPLLGLLVVGFEFNQRGDDFVTTLQDCGERIPHLMAMSKVSDRLQVCKNDLFKVLGTYEVMSMKFSCCLFNSMASSIRRF